MYKKEIINTDQPNFLIRKSKIDDEEQIWKILKPIIRNGETYAIDRNLSRRSVLNYWMYGKNICYVLEINNNILGLYYMRPNQEGGGNHICNCGFAVMTTKTRNGIGRKMLNHSLNLAKEMGFKGMQFNLVVSNNKWAIKLWKSEGFKIVGQIPSAFNHPTDGLIDAFIMFKKLS